jgi:DNA-binding MarR family transcriptional regulator
MSDLARDEDLNPTMLSRVVAGLVERGLLERVQDPADRRAVIVQATERAAELRARVQRARTDVLAARLELLPREDAEALERALPVLERLVDDLQDAR